MKKLLKNLLGLSLAVLAATFVTGCVEANSDPLVEYKGEEVGLPVTKIELSESNFALFGIKGRTSKVVSATLLPSYATNKKIEWTTSDDKVVTVTPSEDTLSATVTLAGEGTATVSAKCGVAVSAIEVTGALETTACGPVSNIDFDSQVYPNHIIITWTNPEDYDNDLDKVEVEVYKAGALVKTVSAPAAAEECDVKDLLPNAEYKFKLFTVDANGNKSDGVESSVSTTGDADTTPPAALETFAAVANYDGTIAISWTNNGSDDSDVWFINIETVPQDSSEEIPEPIRVYWPIKDSKTSFVVEGLERSKSYKFKLTQVDMAYNESAAVVTDTVRVVKEIYDFRVVDLNKKFKVSWKVDEAFAYSKVYVEAEHSDSTKVSASVANTVSTLDLALTKLGSYTVRIYGMQDNGTKSEFCLTAEKEHLIRVVKIFNNYGDRTVAASLTNDASNSGPHVIALPESGTDGWTNGCAYGSLKYGYWAMVPAIDGTADAYSFIACDAEGNNEGDYMYIDSGNRMVITSNMVNTGWWCDLAKTNGFAKKVGTSKTPNAADAAFKVGDTVSGAYRKLISVSTGDTIHHANCIIAAGTDAATWGFNIVEQ